MHHPGLALALTEWAPEVDRLRVFRACLPLPSPFPVSITSPSPARLVAGWYVRTELISCALFLCYRVSLKSPTVTEPCTRSF